MASTASTPTSTSAPYAGPSAGEMIRSHTLAHEIIDRHGSASQAVLDAAEIARLRAFVAGPDAYRTALCERLGTEDPKAALLRLQAQAGGGVSLVDYVAALHGSDDVALTDDEMVTLQTWFANGGGQ